MTDRTPEDRLVRACVWRILILFCVAFWAAFFLIVIPAIYANASTGPAHCRGLTPDECAARAEGGW